MKVMIAVLISTFVAYANANAIGQVVDEVKVGAPVGSHGPALINIGYGGYGGYEGNGGYGGIGGGYGGYGGYGPIGIGGHGLPSLAVNGWGVAGDGHGHEGKYIASNRGAVHIAPLVGHIQSVKSTNGEPAPGTTW